MSAIAWCADFCRIAAKGAIVNSVNSGVSGPNLTNIVHNVEKFILFNLFEIGIAILQSICEYLWKTLTYWSRQCLTALPPSVCSWTKCGKIFDARRTSSHVLNSGVTEPNLTKISYKVENWWPIKAPILKIQYSMRCLRTSPKFNWLP